MKRGIIKLLDAYQRLVSPLLGSRCRFYPSCSEYARLCFNTLPLPRAAVRTISRLARCHPFHPGGFDLP